MTASDSNHRSVVQLVLLAFAFEMSSCGAGTAAAVSGGGGSSGSGNAASIITGLSLEDTRVSPARVRFTLADEESDPARVQFFYETLGDPARSMGQLGGVPSNPASLATSATGVAYALDWNFVDEDGIPIDGSFVAGVRVFATIEGGIQEIVLGANADAGGIGNDAPILSGIQAPTSEVSGIVLVKLNVSDSSNDEVSVRVEFDIVGDAPDAGWRLARPAQAKDTPEFGIDDVVANVSGTPLAFFWDTNVDLAELEHDVRLRFVAIDRDDRGLPLAQSDVTETPLFRIDNNEEPIAEINDLALVQNGDTRRGVPVPFRVIDEESDEVSVVFQWRTSSEEFIELPADPATLEAIQADPALCAQYHLCTEYPTYVGGRLVPVDATRVRLPELASSAATILAHGIVGRTLEIVRSSVIPEPVTDAWRTNPLVHPVGALPIDGGSSAIVLDRPSSGTWRLQRVDLATGSATSLVAGGVGDPSALTFERGETSVLVAADQDGTWQVVRVALLDGSARTLVVADGSTETGTIRGMASLGTNAALITVGSALVRVDWSDASEPSAAVVLAGLATPWGVVIDPVRKNRIWFAERDAKTSGGVGVIRSIRLDGLDGFSIVTPPIQILDDVLEHALDRPEALGFGRSGTRLLAIAQDEPLDDVASLQTLEVGSSAGNRSFVLRTGFAGAVHSVAATEGDCVLVTEAETNTLYAGGGVHARATIESYDVARQTVTCAASAIRSVTSYSGWRIRVPDAREPRRPGASNSFVWDMRDVENAGEVYLRAIPTDAERGIESVMGGPKTTQHALDVQGVMIGDESTPPAMDVVAGDLDGDGDIDLATANLDGASPLVYFQSSPGEFELPPLMLGVPGVTDEPASIAAADLDGDGDLDLASASVGLGTIAVFFQSSAGEFATPPLTIGNAAAKGSLLCVITADLDNDCDVDLACANQNTNTLEVYFQSSAGRFSQSPLVLGDPIVTFGPQSLAAADLDSDGDMDLVSANFLSNTLTVFFQVGPGEFASTPLTLGDFETTTEVARVVAADLDADGDVDLATASSFLSTLLVFFQTSPGVFSTEPMVLRGSAAINSPFPLAAADLNGDGDADLIVGHFGSPSLSIFQQTSAGHFSSSPLALDLGAPGAVPSAFALADFDGDGDVDVAASRFSSFGMIILFQSSPGDFTRTPSRLQNPVAEHSPFSLAAADLDGDGDRDIASANYSDHRIEVFPQLNPGVFASVPMIVGRAPTIQGPYAVVAADLDSDGDVDLASANFESSTLAVYFQASGGAFSDAPLLLGDPASTIQPVALAAADIDGDGHLDIASANYGSNSLTVFFQSGAGVFEDDPLTLGDSTSTRNPHSVQAADLDGDTDLDLVSANYSAGTLTVFFQTSPRVFASVPLTLAVDTGTSADPRSVTAADLDGDGDLDLASANEGSDSLTVFFQTSPGQFYSEPLVLTGSGPWMSDPFFVTAFDVDGDGDNDLASANAGGLNTLTAFMQLSPGVFATEPQLIGLSFDGLTHQRSHGMTLADIDGDGDVDAVSANETTRAIEVFWCTD